MPWRFSGLGGKSNPAKIAPRQIRYIYPCFLSNPIDMLDIVIYMLGVFALGLMARHFALLDENAYGALNNYIYYVSMPALIFVKLVGTHLDSGYLLLIMGNALPILAMMLLVAAAWKFKALNPKMAGCLVITAFFGNIVYMGFPVAQFRFGEAALADASVIAFVYNFLIFSLGIGLVGLIAEKKSDKYAKSKIFGNTVIISCLLGALISLAQVQMPSQITHILEMVGGTTAPLALFSMGLFMYGKKIGKDPLNVAVLSVFKLAIFPALFIISSIILGLRGAGFELSFLEALMPIAVTNFVIAEKFDLDKEVVAEAILVTTLISIPVLLGFDWMLALLPK